MAPDDTIFCTDDGDQHGAQSASLEGKVLLTIGLPANGAWMSGQPSTDCTHTAFAPNGRHLRLRRLRQRLPCSKYAPDGRS